MGNNAKNRIIIRRAAGSGEEREEIDRADGGAAASSSGQGLEAGYAALGIGVSSAIKRVHKTKGVGAGVHHKSTISGGIRLRVVIVSDHGSPARRMAGGASP